MAAPEHISKIMSEQWRKENEQIPEPKKTRLINFRADDATHERLVELTQELGFSVADFFRHCISEHPNWMRELTSLRSSIEQNLADQDTIAALTAKIEQYEKSKPVAALFRTYRGTEIAGRRIHTPLDIIEVLAINSTIKNVEAETNTEAVIVTKPMEARRIPQDSNKISDSPDWGVIAFLSFLVLAMVGVWIWLKKTSKEAKNHLQTPQNDRVNTPMSLQPS